MLPRQGLPTPAWRLAALLLVSLGVAGRPGPALALPDLPGGPPAPAIAAPGQDADHSRVAAAYGRLPLSFEPNQGQADPSVDFVAHGQGYTLGLSAGTATLSVRLPPRVVVSTDTSTTSSAGLDQPPRVVGLDLVGSKPQPQVISQQPLPGTVNYFLGSDPSQWRTGVPTYDRVQYLDVYPGIDLTYYGTGQGQLEDDFVLAPGADPRLIQLAFDGADQVQLEDSGELVLQVAGAQIRQAAPVLYQDGAQGRQRVAGNYRVDELGDVGFAVGAYDPTRPLIIDPILDYSTFLGGSGSDQGAGIAVDAAGNAYLTGSTGSVDFPTTSGAFQRPFGGGTVHAFVSKLNSTGTALVYSTYLGGTGFEDGLAITVDATGSAYVTGDTGSVDFPTTSGAFQRTFGGGTVDAFVSKLNSTGTALVYSTYLGGTNVDTGAGIRVDATGNAYVTGRTDSADFPITPGAFQITGGFPQGTEGFSDTFVSKLDRTGAALVYSTYLGGNASQETLGIAVDAAGRAFVTGDTQSTDFPTTPGAFQRAFQGQFTDAFVTELNSSGTALVYSTYLGGTSVNEGTGIAVDAAGSAYVTGNTHSSDFPTTQGAFERNFQGGSGFFGDAFVSKLNSSGTALVYSTYLGGSDSDAGLGIAVDAAGDAYVIGSTSSTDFPTTPGAFQRPLGGADFFVSKLNPKGTGLAYSTHLGGNGTRAGIAVDAVGNAYVAGTASASFPITPGVLQRTFGGGTSDASVAKIAPGPPACAIMALISGPPARLEVAIHADRGLSHLVVTQATNTTVALPSFTAGSTDTFMVTATKINPSVKSTFTLRASDQTGVAASCDPALVTVGRERGESPVQVVHHLAASESLVAITNGTPGVDRVRLLVNGQRFDVSNLEDGETRILDASSAMRRGSDNTILVVAHGPRDSSAVVIVSDA